MRYEDVKEEIELILKHLLKGHEKIEMEKETLKIKAYWVKDILRIDIQDRKHNKII